MNLNAISMSTQCFGVKRASNSNPILHAMLIKSAIPTFPHDLGPNRMLLIWMHCFTIT